MTILRLEVKDCSECPKCDTKRTYGAGYAIDYFCTLCDNKVTSGYVEWSRDMNPVPNWCPLIVEE